MSRLKKKSTGRSRRLKKTAKRLAAYSATAAATFMTAQDRSAKAAEVVWDIADITVNTESINFFMDTGVASTGTGTFPYGGMTTLGRMRLTGHVSGFGDDAYIYAPTSNSGFVATANNNVARLLGDSSVSAADNFGIAAYAAAPNDWYGSLQVDAWGPGEKGFVGIRFDLADGTHFGWSEITRESPLVPQLVTLHGFGYNDTPGAASRPPVPLLTLEVNTLTGATTMLGDDDTPADINFYEITSAGNSLDAENWVSLADQDFDGNGPPSGMGDGWEESGGVGAHALAEGYLLGSSTIDASASVSLGMGYDVDVDAQDLAFSYRISTGLIQTGVVDYVSGPTGDFNGDGNWDCLDIDALVTEIVAGDDNAAFDMNGDGLVTLADITDEDVGWLAVGGENNPDDTGGNPFLEGDANLDGAVDVSDFNIWNGSKFTSVAAWCSGDFNADGSVDVSDFNIWNGEKFTSSAVAAAVVPEPSSILLLAAGAAGLAGWRRRKKKGDLV